MVDVFISYKKERRAHAERLAQILEAHGYEVWWDYELAVGPDFREQIEAKLESATTVIVLWCSGAVKSKFVRSEANRADKRGKLIQAYLEWVEPPLGFEEAQGQPLVNWSGEPEGEVLAGLLAALKERVGARRRMENIIRMMGAQPSLPSIEPLQVAPDEDADLEENATAKQAAPVVPNVVQTSQSSLADSRWALIERSLDIRDYEDFLEVFGNSEQAFDARRHKRQLEDWGQIDHNSSKAVQRFLDDPAKGMNLFAALDEHANRGKQRAEVAEAKAEEERRAAEKARLEEKRLAEEAARREREELDRRLGPSVAKARQAAVYGAPVSERVFQLDLPGVRNWPKPEIVAIPPGTFLMGSPIDEEKRADNEGPQHEVRIDYPFALGKHTVTFAEWDAAVAAGAKLEKPSDEGWERGDRPVINVSWEDAKAYLDWLNGKAGLAGKPDSWRLPSEAEWEYACRSGTTTPFSFGETISTAQANYDGDLTYGAGEEGRYLGKTAPVGDYTPNAFGLHQMHGNVCEWCADPWHDTYDSAPSDGSVWKEGGDASRRVLRGGSCFSYPQFLRSAYRSRNKSDIRNNFIGFRLARTL